MPAKPTQPAQTPASDGVLIAEQTLDLRTTSDVQGCPFAFETIVLPLDRFPDLVPGDDFLDIVELAHRYAFRSGVPWNVSVLSRPTRKIAPHLEIADRADLVKSDRVAGLTLVCQSSGA